MRIVHYVNSTDTKHGGVPRFVLDASRVMASYGHPSTILTMDATHTPEEWLSEEPPAFVRDRDALPRVRVIPAPGTLGVLGATAMAAVREVVSKADVVHLHCVWDPAAMQIAAAARSLGVPYVVSSHGMLDDWSMAQGSLKKRLFLAAGGRRTLEHAARVHTTATAELDQSGKWFPRGQGCIIPYIIDLEPYRDLPGAELARRRFDLPADGTPTVLFLSRLHVKKGIEHLIGAAESMKRRGIAARFVIAGTGEASYEDTLRRMVRDRGLGDMVRFVGQVMGAEKLSLYQAADLFVLPTSQENFGLVLVESLACGTPIVTTKGVDIWQDVEASGAAAIVEQDAEDIAETVTEILGDPARLGAMRRASRAWALSTFDQDVVAAQFEGMYRECSLGVPAPAVDLPPRTVRLADRVGPDRTGANRPASLVAAVA